MNFKNINIASLIPYRIIHLLAFMVFYGFLVLPTVAQEMSSAERKLKVELSGGASVPKELQISKTIVVISMDDGEDDLRGDWKALAEQAHFYVQRLGIDAVLYFYIDDLIAGYDVQKAISEQMQSREIKNILLLSKDKINDQDQYIGVLTTWNDKPDIISSQQPAWKSQTSDLEILFRNLARSIDAADLTLENLLILDRPEYYQVQDLVAKKRLEDFNTDLRIDKLAVPKFENVAVAGSDVSSEDNETLAKNSQLEQLMAEYPYKFGFISYEYDEKKLLTQGYQFILMSIHTSGRNVRRALGYEVDEDTQELITMKKSIDGQTIVKSIPMDGMVYKYYVKHINSGEIFLGAQWDGDDTWQDALYNHLSAIIVALEKK